MEKLSAIEISEETFLQLCTSVLTELRTELENVWFSALQKYAVLQKEEKKGPARYAYLSLLRSGVLTNQAWFQLDLKDGQGWGDIVDCTEDWWLIPALMQLEFTPLFSRLGKKHQEEAEIAAEKKALLLASQMLEFVNANGVFLFSRITAEYPKIEFGIGEYMGEYVID